MDSTPGRILIADDEPSLLKMMTAYLTRLGYPVSSVHTTAEAWNEVKTQPDQFVCAVLDATMAGMPLQELASNILNANSSLRVLVASGFPVDISALEAEAPSRVAFLHKPFTPEMLANAVRSLLAPQKEDI